MYKWECVFFVFSGVGLSPFRQGLRLGVLAGNEPADQGVELVDEVLGLGPVVDPTFSEKLKRLPAQFSPHIQDAVNAVVEHPHDLLEITPQVPTYLRGIHH